VSDINEIEEGNRADDVDEDDDFNSVEGGTARDVLDYITRAIVDDADSIEIEAEERRGRVELRLHVAPDDMGKVIGKRGRVVQAIRTLVRAAAARDGLDADVDIVD